MLKVAACLFCAMSSAFAYRSKPAVDGIAPMHRGNATLSEDRADVFSILNTNTFLLEIRLGGYSVLGGGVGVVTKPDMKQRADGFVQWFGSLKSKDVPDVVVFNEIFSKQGSTVLKRLCNPKWKRNAAQVVECVSTSKFGSATRVLNPAGYVKISGGVVIMVRKGLELADFAEEPFEDKDIEDGMSQKGFLRVKVRNHPVGDVWVIGTHTQAWPANAAIRVNQFKQIWTHIQKTIPAGERVILAGDMNTESPEIQDMKQALHAENPPVNENGFWMPLRTPLRYSSYGSGGQNAYLNHDIKEALEKSPHDQILYVSDQSGYKSPTSMQWQYLPMKSDTCFETGLASNVKTIQIDDLSDHYAAYAELCFGERCAPSELSGHRGFTGIHRDDAFRCCPGRGKIGDKCFDWADGGIKFGRIGFNSGSPSGSVMMRRAEGGYCTKTSHGSTCPIINNGQPLWAANAEECEAKLADMDLPFKLVSC